jgi:hypothetical protein
MKKSFVRGTWQVKRAFSPAVITEGGRTIFVAGHTGQIDLSPAISTRSSGRPFATSRRRWRRPAPGWATW